MIQCINKHKGGNQCMKNSTIYTVKDVCEALSVSRQAVSRWILEGRLKAIRTPTNRIRISEQEYLRVTMLGK